MSSSRGEPGAGHSRARSIRPGHGDRRAAHRRPAERPGPSRAPVHSPRRPAETGPARRRPGRRGPRPPRGGGPRRASRPAPAGPIPSRKPPATSNTRPPGSRPRREQNANEHARIARRHEQRRRRLGRGSAAKVKRHLNRHAEFPPPCSARLSAAAIRSPAPGVGSPPISRRGPNIVPSGSHAANSRRLTNIMHTSSPPRPRTTT